MALPFVDVPRLAVQGISIVIFPALALCALWPLDRHRPNTFKRSLFFFLFLYLYSVSYFININNLDGRGGRHIVYYAITFFVYYFSTAYCARILGQDMFRRLVFSGLIVLLFVGVLEIGVYFLFGYGAYSEFLNHGTNVGTFADHIPRMRSLFNEPSHLAMYVAAVAPIVWPLGWHARVVVASMIFFTFSTSLFIGLTLAGIGLSLHLIVSGNNSTRWSVLISALIVTVILLLNLDVVFGKFLGMQYADPIRYDAFTESFKYLLESPVYGLGPTFYYNYYDIGLFNWYLQLCVEAGFLGLALMLLFLFSHLRDIYRGMGVVGLFFSFSVFIQYVGMNHYYLPGLWVLLSFSVVLSNEQRAVSRTV